MDSGCQFLKLLLCRGPSVEIHQGRIDGGEIQLGVGTSEAAHAGEGGGHGAHGKQVQDPAPQPLQDVRHGGGKVPQAAGRGDDCIAGGVQGVDGLGQVGLLAPCRVPEHAGEGAVDRVGGTQTIGMDGQAEVLALRPVLETIGIHAVGLGTEGSGFSQGQIQHPALFHFIQRDVPPAGSRRIAGSLPQQGQDLLAHACSTGEVGAQKGPPALGPWLGVGQREHHPIPHEAEQPGTGWRGHHRLKHGQFIRRKGGPEEAYSMGSRP